MKELMLAGIGSFVFLLFRIAWNKEIVNLYRHIEEDPNRSTAADWRRQFPILRVSAILNTLSPPDRQRNGVPSVDILLSFFYSVAASVVAYYIGKWLDRM